MGYVQGISSVKSPQNTADPRNSHRLDSCPSCSSGAIAFDTGVAAPAAGGGRAASFGVTGFATTVATRSAGNFAKSASGPGPEISSVSEYGRQTPDGPSSQVRPFKTAFHPSAF